MLTWWESLAAAAAKPVSMEATLAPSRVGLSCRGTEGPTRAVKYNRDKSFTPLIPETSSTFRKTWGKYLGETWYNPYLLDCMECHLSFFFSLTVIWRWGCPLQTPEKGKLKKTVQQISIFIRTILQDTKKKKIWKEVYIFKCAFNKLLYWRFSKGIEA